MKYKQKQDPWKKRQQALHGKILTNMKAVNVIIQALRSCQKPVAKMINPLEKKISPCAKFNNIRAMHFAHKTSKTFYMILNQ